MSTPARPTTAARQHERQASRFTSMNTATRAGQARAAGAAPRPRAARPGTSNRPTASMPAARPTTPARPGTSTGPRLDARRREHQARARAAGQHRTSGGPGRATAGHHATTSTGHQHGR
ncbi:MAG TPA: hypothetical protein VMV92_04530 [Streptosporangiaceae bacterium]|nr:hypothetical protein [Streptosporangiaceae bacterium]